MSTESNRKTIRRAFVAWRDGGAPVTDVFAPEMTWRIEGRSVVAGDYANRQEFIDRVLAPFGARFAEGERFRPVRIHALCADGDTVIVRWDGHGVANDGIPYDNSYAWFMTLRDGLVVDGTAYFDSIAFDELWRRCDAAVT
ncbi:MAG TPA: nuclear transport factor 2 family protein [Gaiellaceae bacterium]|nr:nuclear transport factor 2 family protein [Gaiellaceae bacterium]